MRILILLLTMAVVYLLSLAIFELLTGAPKEKSYLKKYYSHITGVTVRRTPLHERLLGLHPDQLVYAFNSKKYLRYALPACAALFFFFSLFFFRSLPFSLLLSIVGLFYPRVIVMSTITKRKMLLNNQLKEAMFSLSSSLRAGSSLQTAISRSVSDMEQIFQGEKETPILTEFRQLNEGLKMGFTIEEVLTSFKNRVGLEDVDDMVNATLIAKNKGGNLAEVFMNIAKTISEKIEIKSEIQVLTSSKRMESKILSFMPIVIVGSISLLSPEYMAPLYESLVGRFLMFVGCFLILLNYVISRKIIQIDV